MLVVTRNSKLSAHCHCHGRRRLSGANWIAIYNWLVARTAHARQLRHTQQVVPIFSRFCRCSWSLLDAYAGSGVELIYSRFGIELRAASLRHEDVELNIGEAHGGLEGATHLVFHNLEELPPDRWTLL